MKSRRFFPWCISICVFFLLTGQLLAQEEEEDVQIERPKLQIGTLTPDFKLDGIMNDPVWSATTASIENLITVEPEEGGVPAGKTVIKVLANTKEIVVGIWCYDDKPEGIVSFSKVRDSELDAEEDIVMLTSEDHVLLVFDTFQDGRSGYVFGVNPSGSRLDGLVIEHGEDVYRDWDTIWEGKTSRDGSGWYAEIRIPIQSLSFKKDLDTWGFNVQRRVQRLQEVSRWSGANLDYEFYQTSRAGLLTGLPEFDFGWGLSIRPALVGRVKKPGPEDKTEYEGEPSLDVTQKLGPNLLASLTVNTDFAETEVDIRKINLTRFPLYFPEKRTFFLEGSDIFEFGVGLDDETLIPFFSRRIGLLGLDEDDQLEIPINVGGQINGRVGNTNLGALLVNTRKVKGLELGDGGPEATIDVPQTTMGAFRIKQNIWEESSLGMLATIGDQRGRSGAWSAGLDFTYRTSSFMDDKNFLVSLWGLLNDREDLEGEKSAFGFRVAYPNDLWDINFSSFRIGDGFDPSLGFVPRNDVHMWDFGVDFKPRPSWPWVRQMFHEFSFTLYNYLDNSSWESYTSKIKPLEWLLESGDSFEFSIEPQGDKPPEDFEIASDVDIPPGTYKWVRYALGAMSAGKRKISGGLNLEFGDYYSGNLNTVEARLVWKTSAFLTLELAMERNTGTMLALPDDYEELEEFELEDKEFTEQLFSGRLQLNFTPDLQLSSITQYDTESHELGTNIRLRWTFHPLGDLFIVYNHNAIRSVADRRWEFVSNEFPVKIQFAFRF